MSNSSYLTNHIEAMIFCAPSPVSFEELHRCLQEMLATEIPVEDVVAALSALEARYSSDQTAIQLLKVAGGYQMLTKPAYRQSVALLLKNTSKKRLSQAALETLAIIAYKQPVTKAQIEQIRGVACDYALQKLLEKELIEIKGKSDAPGRPLLYGTSLAFMQYFNLNDLKDLPQPKDLPEESGENPAAFEVANL
ncbi:MAG: SMC-Scp complex subunit ScpB [Cytophagales bacterium]|nr:SMC-Scp complex subunit ScpB [Bernardetiaceae bacterium]MDW8204756.1 SMC-Scp complex subunit ScpB [Cytophagales bacterium]